MKDEYFCEINLQVKQEKSLIKAKNITTPISNPFQNIIFFL